MNRFVPIPVLVLLLGTPCLSFGDGADRPAESNSRGPVWAYGTEVRGQASFDVRDGVAYYQGVYQYWPRAKRMQQADSHVDSVYAATCNADFAVLDEAAAAAQSAQTPAEWTDRYTRILDAHGDVVASYTPLEDCIVIEFRGNPVKCVISNPVGRPKPVGRTAPNPDSTREDQVARFWKFYDRGSWVIWGSDYFTIVPPVWQAKTAAAIDQITSLIRSGLTGDALQSAIGHQVDVKNTALEESNFLRDLITLEKDGR